MYYVALNMSNVFGKHLSVMRVCSVGSGWTSSLDLCLGSERHLFAFDLAWGLLCSSTTLNESLLQVAVWVSIIAVTVVALRSMRNA